MNTSTDLLGGCDKNLPGGDSQTQIRRKQPVAFAYEAEDMYDAEMESMITD